MKTILNIKIDKTLKLAAKKTAEDIGVPLGTVVNAFLRQFARDKEITISAAPRPSPRLREIIAEAERDIAADRHMSPAFSSVKDALKYLHS